jgi:hypothetical protein
MHLRSHAINPYYLRNNDFEKFIEQRKDVLLEWIFEAMGKKKPIIDMISEGEDMGEDEDEMLETVEYQDPENI